MKIWEPGELTRNGKNKIDLMGFCPSYMVFSGDRIFYTNEEQYNMFNVIGWFR